MILRPNARNHRDTVTRAFWNQTTHGYAAADVDPIGLFDDRGNRSLERGATHDLDLESAVAILEGVLIRCESPQIDAVGVRL